MRGRLGLPVVELGREEDGAQGASLSSHAHPTLTPRPPAHANVALFG